MFFSNFLNANLQTFLNDIEDKILEISSQNSTVFSAVKMIISTGKKVRPALMFLLAKNQNITEKIFPLAVAIEMIHMASLFHDDVIDDAKTRRGVKTANFELGNQKAILVGDFLFAESFYLLSNEFATIASKFCSILTRGELLQLEVLFQKNPIDIKTYTEIIYAKTGALFELASILVAKVCNKNESNFSQIGKSIGIVFQILDDILDYTAQEKDFGKKSGKDYLEGKMTLPIILASDNTKKLFFLEQKDKFLEIQNLLHSDGSITSCMQMADKYQQDVFFLLEQENLPEVKKFMQVLIERIK